MGTRTFERASWILNRSNKKLIVSPSFPMLRDLYRKKKKVNLIKNGKVLMHFYSVRHLCLLWKKFFMTVMGCTSR